MKNHISNGHVMSAQPLTEIMAVPNRVLQETRMRLNQGKEGIESFVQKQPAIGIGVAFCLGVVIGWAVKRW